MERARVKVVTGPEMRAIEQQMEVMGTPIRELAQRAGRALSDAAVEMGSGGDILILAGPGNNGGDGEIAANNLVDAGLPVTMYTFRRNPGGFHGPGIRTEDDADLAQLEALLKRSSLVVDCLLGTGSTRPPAGRLADIVDLLNRHGPAVLAADIPTGVNPDTGGVPTVAVLARRTLAFGFAKVGDVVFPGAGFAGRVDVASLGMPAQLADAVDLSVTTASEVSMALPRRKSDSNKGTYGRVLVVGGSQDFPSAPGLSSIAALRAGAGLAHAAVIPFSAQVIASHALEPVYSVLPETDGRISPDAVPAIEDALNRAGSVVFGPGLGSGQAIDELVSRLMSVLREKKSVPAVVDADALNALARVPGWWQEQHPPLVLTPHPGEMARLTGRTIAEVQADRVGVARESAAQWRAIVVLKGAGTVIADPGGRTWINPTGGPNLATGGTGDVLSGMIGGLLAQKILPVDAAVTGVYLHGLAGDLVAEKYGDAGTLAGDLLDEIPSARGKLLFGGVPDS